MSKKSKVRKSRYWLKYTPERNLHPWWVYRYGGMFEPYELPVKCFTKREEAEACLRLLREVNEGIYTPPTENQ